MSSIAVPPSGSSQSKHVLPLEGTFVFEHGTALFSLAFFPLLCKGSGRRWRAALTWALLAFSSQVWALRWGRTPQEGCVLARPLGLFLRHSALLQGPIQSPPGFSRVLCPLHQPLLGLLGSCLLWPSLPPHAPPQAHLSLRAQQTCFPREKQLVTEFLLGFLLGTQRLGSQFLLMNLQCIVLRFSPHLRPGYRTLVGSSGELGLEVVGWEALLCFCWPPSFLSPLRPRPESSCKDSQIQGIVSVPRIRTVPRARANAQGCLTELLAQTI